MLAIESEQDEDSNDHDSYEDNHPGMYADAEDEATAKQFVPYRRLAWEYIPPPHPIKTIPEEMEQFVEYLANTWRKKVSFYESNS